MGFSGGVTPEDCRRWGKFTTFKENAAVLLRKSLRPGMVIYCSPVVDPYQPAEAVEQAVPAILDALIQRPPRVFTIQTRAPLILRDLARLVELARRTQLRISFSLTTDRDDVRKLYEPHCETLEERLAAIACLRQAGLTVFATLAPILPCNPERFARLAIDATDQDIVGDPLHVRAAKPRGATTREAAWKVSACQGYTEWHDPEFQQQIIGRIRGTVEAAGRRFGVGTEGFGWLARAAA
jgi:DNA repair photolyase